MTSNQQCRAITSNGDRCSRTAKTAGFCGNHFPKRKAASLPQKMRLAGEIVAAAGGLIALIEKLVHLWQSLPFGPGPSMPDDYEYLSDSLGPSFPHMPAKVKAADYGKESVDWATARVIFDGAHEVLESNVSEPEAASTLTNLEGSTERLIETMQVQIREMFCEELGQEH